MSCVFLSGPPSRPPVPVSKPRCSIADCLPQPCLTCFLIGSQNKWHKRDPGGTCQNFDRDAHLIFFGFEIWSKPTFLGWPIFWAIFLGLSKVPLFFWV